LPDAPRIPSEARWLAARRIASEAQRPDARVGDEKSGNKLPHSKGCPEMVQKALELRAQGILKF